MTGWRRRRARALAPFALLLATALPSCSPGSSQANEPTGQLLVGLGDTVATVDVASAVLEPLPLDAAFVFDARWRPDGRAVVVEALIDGDGGSPNTGPQIYVAVVDDLMLRLVDAAGPRDSDPTWGPMCDSIVVRRENPQGEERGSSIWRLEIDGSDATQLADVGGVLMNPDWAGDGSRLTFFRRHDQIGEVWILDGDDTDPTLIVGEAEGQGGQPRISPDGDLVVFVRNTEYDETSLRPQLFIHDLTTGHAEQITNDPAGYDTPVWSPDGQWIAFSDESGWIHLIRSDGSGHRKLESRGLPLDWGPVTGSCGGSDAA